MAGHLIVSPCLARLSQYVMYHSYFHFSVKHCRHMCPGFAFVVPFLCSLSSFPLDRRSLEVFFLLTKVVSLSSRLPPSDPFMISFFLGHDELLSVGRRIAPGVPGLATSVSNCFWTLSFLSVRGCFY